MRGENAGAVAWMMDGWTVATGGGSEYSRSHAPSPVLPPAPAFFLFFHFSFFDMFSHLSQQPLDLRDDLRVGGEAVQKGDALAPQRVVLRRRAVDQAALAPGRAFVPVLFLIWIFMFEVSKHEKKKTGSAFGGGLLPTLTGQARTEHPPHHPHPPNLFLTFIFQ
jgi:hypothetical protein